MSIFDALELPSVTSLEASWGPLSGLWADVWGARPAAGAAEGSLLNAAPADVFETADEVVVRIDLPGVRPEDVQVRWDQGNLEVRAVRQASEVPGEVRWYVRQVAAGTYRRVFRLGVPVDAAAVTATTQDGVLEIHLPKAEAAKPLQVPVRSAAATTGPDR